MAAFNRYNSKTLLFKLEARPSVTSQLFEAFADKIRARDVIATLPTVTKSGKYSCYATRADGKLFNFVNGAKFLAKLL